MSPVSRRYPKVSVVFVAGERKAGTDLCRTLENKPFKWFAILVARRYNRTDQGS